MKLLFGWAIFLRSCAWCRRPMMPKIGRAGKNVKFTSHSICRRCVRRVEGVV